jgi:hypothetical protein
MTKRALRLMFSVTVGATALLAAPLATGANASPGGHFRQVTVVSPDELCGFTGSSTIVDLENTTPLPTGGFVLAGQFIQTFTATNGRGIVIDFDKGNIRFAPDVINTDGTTTISAIENGVDVRTKAVNGPLLQQSTGRVFFSFTFDADGNIVDSTATALAGPANNLTGEPNCNVITPWLSGG